MKRIPNNAEKVFEGIIFDVYQWDQELFDGSKQKFEIVSRTPSVEGIVIVEDKILFLKEEQPNRPPFFTLPAGSCEEGESPKQAMLREMEEETGYSGGEIYLWKFIQHSSKIVWDSYFYIIRNPVKIGEAKPEPGEKIEVSLISFEEFLEEIEKPEFRNFIIRDIIFRIKHSPGELEKFRNLLFTEDFPEDS